MPRFVRKRSFKLFNEDEFKSQIKECGLEEILSCTNVDVATELLTSKLTEVLDSMAPIRKFQTRHNYVPWMSKATKAMKQNRERAHEKAVRTNESEDWREFRAVRNQVTSMLRQDKKTWERDQLDLVQNSSSDVWKTVKGWLGWGSVGTPTQLFWEGKMVTSPIGLATAMNDFFLAKINGLRNGIPPTTGDPTKKLREAMRVRKCTFQMKKVKESDVLKIIKQLKNSSATGIDYIDTRTLKLIAELIVPSLTHIINLSIEQHVFPSVWKWSKVIPLLKSSNADATIPKSYRPVALLPIMSKVLEKAIFCQVIKYLEDNNLIHPNLHGSRAGHDTSTALLQLSDRWLEELNEGKVVGVLFCDQSAAFDLCDHQLIVDKLKLLGFNDGALNWIKSYLSERVQSCFVDGELSAPLKLFECGVPQGSVGGPLLWLIFTCDQPDIVHDHSIDGNDPYRGCPKIEESSSVECGVFVGYVDDGAYSFGHKIKDKVCQVLTDMFQKLEEWMNHNKLVLNAEKTHLMIMGYSRCLGRTEISISAGGHEITPTETEKLLGAQIHQSLKWNHHIADGSTSLLKQLNARNNALKIVCRNAKFQTRLALANGAFHSKLVYLINLWGGAQQYLLRALQRQQLIAARMVCGSQSVRWSRSKVLKTTGWLSVKQLIEFHLILQAHKTLVSGKPKILNDEISTAYPYETRGATSGHIRLRNSTSQKTFKYRAMVAYNSVPERVKSGSTSSFKRKLKQWVRENVSLD